jgi:hypothetical protein
VENKFPTWIFQEKPRQTWLATSLGKSDRSGNAANSPTSILKAWLALKQVVPDPVFQSASIAMLVTPAKLCRLCHGT